MQKILIDSDGTEDLGQLHAELVGDGLDVKAVQRTSDGASIVLLVPDNTTPSTEKPKAEKVVKAHKPKKKEAPPLLLDADVKFRAFVGMLLDAGTVASSDLAGLPGVEADYLPEA